MALKKGTGAGESSHDVNERFAQMTKGIFPDQKSTSRIIEISNVDINSEVVLRTALRHSNPAKRFGFWDAAKQFDSPLPPVFYSNAYLHAKHDTDGGVPILELPSSPAPAVESKTTRRRAIVALSRAYRISWLSISLLGLVAGFFAGASLVGGQGLPGSSAIVAIGGSITLMATLYKAGSPSNKLRKRPRAQSSRE